MVHFDDCDLPQLHATLSGIRSKLRLPPNYCFKHLGAAPRTQREFFQALSTLPFHAHAHMIDKTTLGPPPRSSIWGRERIRDGIVDLVRNCPDQVVADQLLLIDLPNREQNVVKELRTMLRQQLRMIQRRSFKNVKPCPDHKRDGEIIQVADMIAGELREHGGLAGPYLPWLSTKLHIV